MLIYGSVGGSIVLILILVLAMGGDDPTPPLAPPPPQPVNTTTVTRSGFVDDGKWRQYIAEPIPSNPGAAEAPEMHSRIRKLLPYAQNLEGNDRNSIYRYIVKLSEAGVNSPSMPDNWKQRFNMERAAKKFITH